jgi:catechol 2,3-dioxygenase-like lactoylglutathione lyase family enzyme
MWPADRPLESATNDHVALSVGDLDIMAAFYICLGFDEIARSDLAPAPVRIVVLRNRAGTTFELTAHLDSVPGSVPESPLQAARTRGLFHCAMRVARLEQTVTGAVAAGAQLIAGPALNSRGDARFAYIRDPEGNLIELICPEPKFAAPKGSRWAGHRRGSW